MNFGKVGGGYLYYESRMWGNGQGEHALGALTLSRASYSYSVPDLSNCWVKTCTGGLGKASLWRLTFSRPVEDAALSVSPLVPVASLPGPSLTLASTLLLDLPEKPLSVFLAEPTY